MRGINRVGVPVLILQLMLLIPSLSYAQATKGAASKDGTVWEVSDPDGKRTWRVSLYEDGSTSGDEKWRLDDRTLWIGEANGKLDESGRGFVGKLPGHAPFTGRLLFSKLTLKTNPSSAQPGSNAGQPPNPAGSSSSKKTKAGKSLSETMVDVFELEGFTRTGRAVHLTVDFSADNQVVDGQDEIAKWSADGRRVTLKFVDDRLGEASFSARNTNDLVGKSKGSGGDSWTWSLSRVREQAVWDTDGAKYCDKVVFYTNGRINAARPSNGNGYWSLRGDKLTVWEGTEITLASDGRSFNGRLSFGAHFTGKLISGSMKPK